VGCRVPVRNGVADRPSPFCRFARALSGFSFVTLQRRGEVAVILQCSGPSFARSEAAVRLGINKRSRRLRTRGNPTHSDTLMESR